MHPLASAVPPEAIAIVAAQIEASINFMTVLRLRRSRSQFASEPVRFGEGQNLWEAIARNDCRRLVNEKQNQRLGYARHGAQNLIDELAVAVVCDVAADVDQRKVVRFLAKEDLMPYLVDTDPWLRLRTLSRPMFFGRSLNHWAARLRSILPLPRTSPRRRRWVRSSRRQHDVAAVGLACVVIHSAARSRAVFASSCCGALTLTIDVKLASKVTYSYFVEKYNLKCHPPTSGKRFFVAARDIAAR
jgi:hypothetical protein